MAPDPLVYLFPQLEHVDISSLGVKAAIIVGTFLAITAIFIVSYFGSFRFTTFKSYLSTREKVLWCLTFVSAIFGSVATFLSFWYLLVDDTLKKDVVKATTVSSHFTVYVCVGYFFFECLVLFSSNIIFGNFNKYLALHHVLTIFGYFVVLYLDTKVHFFAVVGLFQEMIAPFTCLSWMLLKAKLAHTMVWKANQLVLIHLFHCRTTLEGYMFYLTYQQWDNVITNMPIVAMFAVYGTFTIEFLILTPYWTYKRMLQLFKPVDWHSILNAATNEHSIIAKENIPEDHTKRD